MGDVLAARLKELGPDHQLRQANLLNLLSCLSLQEVRDVQEALSFVEFRTDILSRLPIDIELHVLEYLDGVELWPCLNVSKTWRAILTLEAAIRMLSKKWFPGLVEHFLSGNSLPQDKKDLDWLFTETVRKYHFRSTGRFRSALNHGVWLEDESYFTLDPIFHPGAGEDGQHPYANICANPIGKLNVEDRVHAPSVFYASGRIAWQDDTAEPPDNLLVVVDNLRTSFRKVFSHSEVLMSTNSAQIAALGDRLLVVCARRQVFAWDLDSNECQKFVLPAGLEMASTEGHRVAIIGSEGDKLYTWKFGGTLREIDLRNLTITISHTPNYNAMDQFTGLSRPPAIRVSGDEVVGKALMHPAMPDATFVPVVTPPEQESGQRRLMVYEYQGQTLRAVFEFPGLPHTQLADDGELLTAQKINEFGLFGIFSGWNRSSEILKGGTCVLPESSRVPWILTLVTFNVFTREFAVQCDHVPAERNSERVEWFYRYNVQPHWWHNQCNVFARVKPKRGNPVLLGFAIRDCGTSLTSPPTGPEVYTTLRDAPGREGWMRRPIRRQRVDPANTNRLLFQLECCEVDIRDAALAKSSTDGDTRLANFVRGLHHGGMPNCKIDYMLDANENLALLQSWESSGTWPFYIPRHLPEGNCLAITGDDDFLILVHHRGYTVWSFGSDLPYSQDLGVKAVAAGRRSTIGEYVLSTINPIPRF